ncbi:MAG: T9SS type A sorting domain-containing protein [Chitinophagaceae bacterium]|nr:T9SS type A sorting domain-containing protein [Chitinophagaceae bacterium]
MSLALGLVIAKNTTAQTCTGEIIKFNENFDTGTTNAALPTGRTTYSYNSTTVLADGDYKLSNSSKGRTEWHGSADHTGNTNGRMMVINASYTVGEFYRDTVVGLTPNASFSVFLYVMNANTLGTCGSGAILPKLQFIVESYNNDGSFTQLTTFTSSSIPQSQNPTWIKVGGYFNLPAGVTAVRYKILNNAPGGCGNDLAIDDITFAQCASLALPVTGMRLKAQLHNGTALLSWSTVQEFNSEKFILERSNDGKNWEAINSQAAAGNSQSTKSYQFIDNKPFKDASFYRILQIDIDGKFTYSNIEIIKAGNVKGSYAISPNPFQNQFSIQLSSDKEQTAVVKLVDMNGKTVKYTNWTLNKGLNNTQIQSLQSLNNGIYMVEVTGTDGSILARTKMVKL